MSEELPFRCEYAKSGRASCKKCKMTIEKDDLRLAVMVRSPFFDGRTPNWFHYDCFFSRQRPKGPEEIACFENLRFEDQKRIEKSIDECKTGNIVLDAGKVKGSKKRKHDDVKMIATDFTVEKAKSSRSTCKLCDVKINKEEIRIGKMDYDSPDAARFGPLNRWFHVTCFANAREELDFLWAASALSNFKELDKADQKMLTKKLPAKEVKPAKEAKAETETKIKDEKMPNDDKKMKKQSDLLFKYLDNLKNLRKNELIELYNHNDIQHIPDDTSRRLEYIADCMAFGVPDRCAKCDGSLRFKICRYICTGNISEWEKCNYATEEPTRKPFKVSKNLQALHTFLKNYKYKPQKRLINAKLKMELEKRTNQHLAEINNIKAEAEGDAVDSIAPAKLLSGYAVGVLGKIPCHAKIQQLGAKFANSIDSSVLFVISSEVIVKKSKSKQLASAKVHTVPIVSENVFTTLVESGNIGQALIGSKIEFWGQTDEEIDKRVDNLNVTSKIESTFKSGAKIGFSKSQNAKSKVILKNGGAVDSDSGLDNVAHILKEGDSLYDVTLNHVDVVNNKNSFYKIQLLENDRMNGRYYLFKSWGRIGTDIGGNKVENFANKAEAIKKFKDLYYERTLNNWDNRKQFKKMPNCYSPIDIDYGECESKLDVITSTSNLPKETKDLISLIFDVSRMKQTMLEFELDLEKMPLGKLSKAQLLNSCSALKEISSIIDVAPINVHKLTAACNKFYTLVPHCFGTARPPLINNPQVISQKMEMLESLMDIELAYDIIKNVSDDADPFDFHYRKLDTLLEPLETCDEEYKLVESYLKNTHAKTHDTYSLEIASIFRVTRNGEGDRFKKFEQNANRMLLWHGSRLTNYVGILSKGLRIAPPEAPVCGYMFGKGIYFADSVSKSANYCCTSMESNTGLLLLSEVALGKSMELTNSKYVTSLEKGFESVKGVGGTHPDPKKIRIMPNGMKVPLGKMIKNKDIKQSSLLYNEYIVYDETRIKIRYLLNVKFKYQSLF